MLVVVMFVCIVSSFWKLLYKIVCDYIILEVKEISVSLNFILIFFLFIQQKYHILCSEVQNQMKKLAVLEKK